MRKNGEKRGALTIEQAQAKATELIAKHGLCLFIVDIQGSRKYIDQLGASDSPWTQLKLLTEAANEQLSEYMPENNLAVGEWRTEKGFDFGLGDARWAGINDAAFIPKFVKLQEELTPELRLHYGIAKDGWDEGMSLVK